MSKPRYRYAHQQERKRWAPVVEGGDAYCAEPICKMKTRWIPPGSKWHLCHDPPLMITTLRPPVRRVSSSPGV